MDPNQNKPDPDSQNSSNETANPVSAWQENNENQTPAYNNTDYWNTTNTTVDEALSNKPEPTEKQELEDTSKDQENPWASYQNEPENSEPNSTKTLDTSSENSNTSQWTSPENSTIDSSNTSENSTNPTPWNNASDYSTSNTNEASDTQAVTENNLSSPKPPSSSSNALMVFMVALVVILLGTTGLFAFQNYQLRQTNNTNSPSPVASLEPSSTPDPTADWKTYTNSELNFIIKYPANFVAKGQLSAPVNGISKLLTYYSDPTTIKEDTDALFDGFNIYQVSTTNSTNLEGYVDNEIKALSGLQVFESKNLTKTQITVDGNSGFSVELSDNRKEYYFQVASKNGKQYIVISTSHSNSSFLPTIDLILSTLKFATFPSNSPISSTNCLTGFEKFTNSNFSFCFPTGMKETTASTTTSVVLENSTETLKVVQNFQGGWGGSPCLAINAVEVAGYKSKRLSWKTEKADNTCESTYTSFATMVNEGVFKSPFPYMMEYTKKSGMFTDDKNFIAIETSFTPAKQ